MLIKSKIRKNDTVEVIAGKDKGKRGEVVRVDLKKERVVVSGVNIVKKAMKKRSQQDQGGIARRVSRIRAVSLRSKLLLIFQM